MVGWISSTEGRRLWDLHTTDWAHRSLGLDGSDGFFFFFLLQHLKGSFKINFNMF